MKRIVVDAGPLIHLHEAGGLALLSKAGEVFAPQIIVAEARSLPAVPEWLIIREPSSDSYNGLQPWVAVGVLEGGEAAALALAVELQAEWFLTDDAEARLVATELGLETHGSLGVVLWAAREGLVQREEATRLLDAIELGSLWMSLRVRSEARRTLASIWRAHDGR